MTETGDTAKSGTWIEVMALLQKIRERPEEINLVWERLERRMNLLRDLMYEEESPAGGTKPAIPPLSSIAEAVVWILQHEGHSLRFSELFERLSKAGLLLSPDNRQSPVHRVRIALQAMKRQQSGVHFSGSKIGESTMIKLNGDKLVKPAS